MPSDEEVRGITAKFMARLAAPFAESEIKWRVQAQGESGPGRPWVRVLAYIDNAAVMNRLDEVCGAANWQNRYEEFEGGVLCGLSIYMGGQWVTKWDGSAATQTEPFKGALSGAMKRAAVQWGIGRYLHGMGEQFAQVVQENDAAFRNARRIKGASFRWLPPKLDAKYLPSARPPAQAAPVQAPKQEAKPLPPNVASVGSVVQAALGPGDMRLPGTNKSLMGYGGTEIKNVTRGDLPAIRARLEEARPLEYKPVIDAINDYLEATRGD